jgi:hypothetical protein
MPPASGVGPSGGRGSRTPASGGASPQLPGSVVPHRRDRSRSRHQVPSGVRLKNRPRPRSATSPTTWPREQRRTVTAFATQTPRTNAPATASHRVTCALSRAGGPLLIPCPGMHEKSLNALAFSATVHCLTGCAIGEVLGMIIGTALGWSDLATIVLAVALAFLFGYSLTSLPLLRAGLTLAAVVPLALASDTISIAIMEVVDNAIMLLIPGAMDATLDEVGFWAALAASLLIAGAAAFPANRWLLARGKGHAVVHRHHAH